MGGVDGCSRVSWFAEVVLMGRLVVIGSYQGVVSNFCCSSPPKSSRCTSCRIQTSQPVIVDRLHMAIFVFNLCSSLAQESSQRISAFLVVLVVRTMLFSTYDELELDDHFQVSSDPYGFVESGRCRQSSVYRGCCGTQLRCAFGGRHSLWWYSIHRIHEE